MFHPPCRPAPPSRHFLLKLSVLRLINLHPKLPAARQRIHLPINLNRAPGDAADSAAEGPWDPPDCAAECRPALPDFPGRRGPQRLPGLRESRDFLDFPVLRQTP